jgi:hypothetical protein
VTDRREQAADLRVETPLSVPPQDRRDHTERRKYSRRGIDLMGPPYHQTFERIAVALEHIELLLRERADN